MDLQTKGLGKGQAGQNEEILFFVADVAPDEKTEASDSDFVSGWFFCKFFALYLLQNGVLFLESGA